MFDRRFVGFQVQQVVSNQPEHDAIVKEAVAAEHFASPDRSESFENLLQVIDEFSHNTRQISIRFCNFKQLYNMLNIEPRLGVVLPCRITVVERTDGSVLLVAPNMRAISHWFNNNELEQLGNTMEEMITDVIEDAFAATGYNANDVDWFVPHQANKRIIDGSAHKLGIAPEKIVTTVDRHGNTSAASIPLALSVAVADGRIKRDDLVLLEAMGGGFTWGSALIRW